MAEIKHHKVVASLPNPLEANSIYYVRVGQGYDQYVTNGSGTIVAYQPNAKLELDGKVDKEEGKGLSSNDYTTTEKDKLAGIEVGAQANTVDSVAGKTGDVALVKADVGLSNVDNTSDANKPISTATAAALNDKVDKVSGKQLSTEDYTTAEKSKLSGIQAGAQVNVATNIGQGSRTSTTIPLTSSTGTGTTLPSATTSLAGLQSAADKAKLNGIATGATANATDAQLRDRVTHTGVQPIASVEGLQGVLDEKVDDTDPRLTNAREWTASVVTQAEAEAGTSTTARKWTAQRVRQAILGWWNTSAFKTKLDGIEDEATKNATDAQLRDRATHTGVQPISSVTGLQTALDGKQPVGNYVTDTDPRLSDSREWTASIVSQAEAEAGTATTARKWTAQRVRQAAIAAWNSVTSAWGRGFVNSADAAAGRTALELGTAATRDVGAATGNIMEVGFSGVGSAVLSPYVSLDQVPPRTGFYRVEGGRDSGLPSLAGQYDTNFIRVKRHVSSSSYYTDIFMPYSTGSSGMVVATMAGSRGGYNRVALLRDSLNTTVDSNGILHNGSTIPTGKSSVTEDRSIVAGTGLSGGGTLAANRTLSVNFGTTAGTVKEGNWMPTWANVTGKPTTFTPSPHTHTLSQITDAGNVAGISTNGSAANYLRGDGTWATPPNTTYSAMSVAEGKAGTATSARTMRADHLKQIIESHVEVIDGGTF